MQGQKCSSLELKDIAISTKIESVLDILSFYLQRPSFFILPISKGRPLDKKKTLQEEGLQHKSSLIVSTTSGKPKVFKRFRDMSTSYWYVGSSWDAIGFRSEKPLLVTGFGCY